MGRRIGLGHLETLMENLKRDITWGPETKFNAIQRFDNSITGTLSQLGYATQWNCNFGGPLQGQDQTESTLNLLTPATVALNLSKVIVQSGMADTDTNEDPPTAASASIVLGGTGVAGADVAIGTTASPGQTPTVTQRITRLTGDVSGTVVMSVGADMASAEDQTLILFTGNTFSSSGVLKLTLHGDNELDAESSELFVTGEDSDIMSRSTAPTDADQILVLTDSGDCTILAGSYIYLHSANNTDVMTCKAMIRTSGGTIAVTYAN